MRRSTPGPLFTFGDGRPLTRQQLFTSVQAILNGAGFSGFYSAHSFRIGAATTAAARGVPDLLRWLVPVFIFLMVCDFERIKQKDWPRPV